MSGRGGGFTVSTTLLHTDAVVAAVTDIPARQPFQRLLLLLQYGCTTAVCTTLLYYYYYCSGTTVVGSSTGIGLAYTEYAWQIDAHIAVEEAPLNTLTQMMEHACCFYQTPVQGWTVWGHRAVFYSTSSVR